MRFTLKEIIDTTAGEVLYKNNTSKSFELNTDTRTIKSDDFFIPIVGQNFDGHNFIEAAIKLGISGYLTQDKSMFFKENVDFIVYVENTTKAYLQLARLNRRKVKPIVIAITGSSGKTTVKEMMACVCEQGFKTYKTKLNHNNEIGLAQTLLDMPKDTEVLVVEMGMRGLGEIECLSEYAEPDIAIIANVGTAHIGRLKTIKNIAKAKCEITKFLHKEGMLIAHDNPLIRSFAKFNGRTAYFSLESKLLKNVEQKQGTSKFIYKGNQYILNIEGSHNIQNALAVIEGGLRLGLPPNKIAAGLVEFKPIEKRWEQEEFKEFTVINDSYNANPDSMKAVLDTFIKLYEGKKCIVLGDMGELGKDERKYHKQIGDYLKPHANIPVICVGKLASYIAKQLNSPNCKCFMNSKDCAAYILENIPEGTTILFKASRSMHFEQIIEEMKSK